MTESVALGVLGLAVPHGSHICTFYRGPSGRDEIEPGKYPTGPG